MAKTRRNRKVKRGGNREQIQHALTQLKRFTERAREGKPFRTLQFGYNLGRLQEMVDGSHVYWWKPVEPLVESQKWTELSQLIDQFKEKIGQTYDEVLLGKE